MIDLWHDGCVSGPPLTKQRHPAREDVRTGGTIDALWHETFRYPQGWLPPVQILAGWLRSLLVSPNVAKAPATADEWAVIESLSEEGLVAYTNGEPELTADGKQFLKACGGTCPRGVQFSPDAMPSTVFRYRSGECPYVTRRHHPGVK